jgi:hypothetical protein
MHEPREYEGWWWRPEEPDRRVPGTLTFSQDELELRLLGTLQDPQPGPIGLDDLPRILGIARQRGESGMKVMTLEENAGGNPGFSSPGFMTATYTPRTVLVGAWYEPDEEVVFDDVFVRYSDLDTWAGTSGFHQQLHPDDDQVSFKRLDVSYIPPPPIEVEIDDQTTLGITWNWTWSGWRPVTVESTILQQTAFRVSFEQGGNLARCLSYVFQLRNFLSLGVGRPVRVLAIRGRHRQPPEQRPREAIDVEILYRLIGTPPEARRELLPDEMLFNLGDAHPRLEEIVTGWFARQGQLGPVLDRYFYIVHGDGIAREIQFESFVRALETHHRRTTDATEVSADVHSLRLSAVLESAPSEHRSWLERRLRYSNELDLATRLRHTMERCPIAAGRIAGSTARQRESFARKVVATRNYEIHLDPKNERAAITDIRIVPIIFRLRALVEMTLLLDLGFPCAEVDSIFERTGRYRRIAEIAEQIV